MREENSEKENVKKNEYNKKSNEKSKPFLKIALIIIIVIILAFISFGAYSYYCLYSMSKNKSDVEIRKEEVKNAEPIKKDESINVLIAGVDVGTIGATDSNTPKRTDTIMLMHYNPEEKKVTAVSIPRDTKIEIKNCSIDKINSASAVDGISYTIDRVETLLDVNINYYVKINYKGFRKIIDAIGGIDMPITHNMNYDDVEQNLHIHFQKGTTVHLDGEKAEMFFRWRMNNDGSGLATGDIGRIDNQHVFIEKVIEKVKSPSIIFKFKNILSTIAEYVETNMEPNEIIKYGLSIVSLNKQNIKMYTLQGEGKQDVDGLSYFFYDSVKSKDILDQINDVKPMSVNRSDLIIEVINCTDKAGLAADYKEYLKQNGYTNVEVGSGEKLDKTKIRINTEFDNNVINNLKNEFKIDNLEEDYFNQSSYDVQVFLGEDHDYKK